jgi:RimJ/RimL family protein N-acetyltransferase
MINWPIDQPTLTAETPSGRLTLRPLLESDIEPVFNACQDLTISAFTRVPYPYDLEMATDFVRESSVAYRNHVSATFAIELNGEFAGTIGLHSLQLGDHLAEVGYWVVEHFRGRGICTSALKMISELSLDVMGFRRIEALANFDNLPSQKVLERAGFNRDALLKNRATKSDGTQIDMALYSISRD